jgi:hypothetical protein
MEITREKLNEVLKIRRNAALKILEADNKDMGDAIEILVLIQCVLDDYLMIKLRSDKIVEGLLADINNSIESGAIALSTGQAEANLILAEPERTNAMRLMGVIDHAGKYVHLAELNDRKRSVAVRAYENGLVIGYTPDKQRVVKRGGQDVPFSEAKDDASHGNEPNSVPAEGAAEANESTAPGTGSDPQAG